MLVHPSSVCQLPFPYITSGIVNRIYTRSYCFVHSVVLYSHKQWVVFIGYFNSWRPANWHLLSFLVFSEDCYRKKYNQQWKPSCGGFKQRISSIGKSRIGRSKLQSDPLIQPMRWYWPEDNPFTNRGKVTRGTAIMLWVSTIVSTRYKQSIPSWERKKEGEWTT